MSYNYLPLDRKPLNFQQMKNLLEYDQLVSITFDAHERILQGREYADRFMDQNEQEAAAEQVALLRRNADGLGDELPPEVVKLMLMLKIKSLSWGESGIHIDTVKRLMEMYNHQILPVIYAGGILQITNDAAALSHLSLPLVGLGEVWYRGEKQRAATVIEAMKWKPLQLRGLEGEALCGGTQFTTALGIRALQKTDYLLPIARSIGALSCLAFGCDPTQFRAKPGVIQTGKGQVEISSFLAQQLQPSVVNFDPAARLCPASFTGIPWVHGAASDQFALALKTILQEVNIVSEKKIQAPTPDNPAAGYLLALALEQLAVAVAPLAFLSTKRTGHLLGRLKEGTLRQGAEDRADLDALHEQSLQLSSATRHLMPASTSIDEDRTDPALLRAEGSVAATHYLRLLEQIEQVLAIELIVAASGLDTENIVASELLNKLVTSFGVKDGLEKSSLPRDLILNTIAFMRTFK